MWVGLGTGSTASWMVRGLARLVQEGLQIKGTVSSSDATRKLAAESGLPGGSLFEAKQLDIYIDGADEVSPSLDLIKGGGGALLHEKILAASSKRFVVVADENKMVPELGDFGVPVEIMKLAEPLVIRRIEELGGKATLRSRERSPFVTDEGNQVLDCSFGKLSNAAQLASELASIPGVVEHGLFVGMAHELVLASEKGVTWQSR